MLKEFSVRFVNYSPRAKASDDYILTETAANWKRALRQEGNSRGTVIGLTAGITCLSK